jgi:hypothetical protein
MATLHKIMGYRRHSRGAGRRRYTMVDMAFIKHDAAVQNAREKRGEIRPTNNRYIAVCGCGAEGCFIHGSF